MKIKHIVISGGGINLFTIYGCLKYLNKKKLWQIKNIKSLYGSSCGSLLSLLICLDITWDELDLYLIKRPWDKLFTMSPILLLESFNKKGVYNIDHFIKMLKPLFEIKDYSIDMTLKELYDITKITLNIFVTEINSLTLMKMNHITYPDMKVVKAVYMSSTLPPLFQPVIENENCYLDGGCLANYPITHACDIINEHEHDSILGIKLKFQAIKMKVEEDLSMVDYLYLIIYKLLNNTISRDSNRESIIENEICIPAIHTLNYYNEIIKKEQLREDLILNGIECGKTFLKLYKHKNKN